MTDLHEKNDPEYGAQIDTVGWIFGAFAIAVAAVAYHGSTAMIANTPVSHVAGSPVREILAQKLWQLRNGSPRSFAPHPW